MVNDRDDQESRLVVQKIDLNYRGVHEVRGLERVVVQYVLLGERKTPVQTNDEGHGGAHGVAHGVGHGVGHGVAHGVGHGLGHDGGRDLHDDGAHGEVHAFSALGCPN